MLKPAVTSICHAQKNGAKMAVFVQKAKYFIMESVFFLISVHVIAVEEVIIMAKHINTTVTHGMYNFGFKNFLAAFVIQSSQANLYGFQHKHL